MNQCGRDWSAAVDRYLSGRTDSLAQNCQNGPKKPILEQLCRENNYKSQKTTKKWAFKNKLIYYDILEKKRGGPVPAALVHITFTPDHSTLSSTSQLEQSLKLILLGTKILNCFRCSSQNSANRIIIAARQPF